MSVDVFSVSPVTGGTTSTLHRESLPLVISFLRASSYTRSDAFWGTDSSRGYGTRHRDSSVGAAYWWVHRCRPPDISLSRGGYLRRVFSRSGRSEPPWEYPAAPGRIRRAMPPTGYGLSIRHKKKKKKYPEPVAKQRFCFGFHDTTGLLYMGRCVY